MNITIDGDGFHVEGDVRQLMKQLGEKRHGSNDPFNSNNPEDFAAIPDELKRCQLCNENLADTPIEQLTINGTSIYNVRACGECHDDL